MSQHDRRSDLPREVQEVIEIVLDVADLDLMEGREEVARELAAHFEDGLGAGASAEEMIARFGDPFVAGRRIANTRPKAAARVRGNSGRWWMSFSEWKQEWTRAIRRLGRAPGFTAIVVLTLALGVGANTAIFTVLNAVLLEDLPYAEPDRLVRIYEGRLETGELLDFLRAPTVAEYRHWDDVFEDVGASYTYRELGADITDGEQPQRIIKVRASAGYFETLGRAPLVGRTFEESESYGPGEATSSTVPIAPVTILSHALWQARYNGSRDVIGATIELDGSPYEIVGVMPASFRDPMGSQADLWVPQDLRRGGSNSFGNYYLTGFARLKDGITVDAAQERLKVLGEGFAATEPEMAGDFAGIRPLQADLVGETRSAMLWILAAAAGLVLLTACVNVANLLFARGLSQDRSIALRSALGSGRGRIIVGILTENGMLAIMGGGLGLAVGWLGVQGMLRLAPDALPGVAEVTFGVPVFVFALGVTAAALLAFGLTPALRMSRTAPANVLRSGDRSSTVGKVMRRIRDGLVIVQVGAALVLVAGAMLLTRSLNSLLDVPLNIETEQVLTFEAHLPGARYPDHESRNRFFVELHDRLSALPSVESVGATSWLPVNGRYHSWSAYWDPENMDGSNRESWYNTDVRVIEGDYFTSLGIDLIRGERPNQVDVEAEQVVWVNQAFVDEVFANVDPMTQSVMVAGATRRIAGIVLDVPHSPRGDVYPKAYVPHLQETSRNWALIQTVRTSGDPGALVDEARAVLRELDPQLVLYRPNPFSSVLDVVRAQDRFATSLMGAFAILALVLSVVGTYGVLAGTVAGRTREIGIRMALGADTISVRRMVLSYAAKLIVPGVALGLAATGIASSGIQALLFGVEAGDPVTYVGAVLVFLSVGGLAAWVPAQRATRVDTIQALTAE
jgi:predicted permease